MKRVLKRILICICIVMVVNNFIIALPGNFAYAGFLSDIASAWEAGGLIGLIARIPAMLLMALAQGCQKLVTALVIIGGPLEDGSSDATPFHILFNKVPLLNVNFLDLSSAEGPVLIFRQAVAGWYYSLRLIASMVLVVILIYIGIKMAISTIASEKATYKKMLVDWVTSLVLLFLLHYIMIFTFACNDALVNALSPGEGKGFSDYMERLADVAHDGTTLAQCYAAVGVYGMIVFQTVSFALAYIKRMFTIGFLITIAPLITITYSIDRIGDQKAQALNTWLKEFIYNILIQPFQCILFLVFAQTALDLLTSSTVDNASLATAIFAILCLQFVKEGEKIVKKIFGFENASSLSDLAAGTALAYAGIAKGKQAGAAAGGAIAGAKNWVASNPHAQKLTKPIRDLKNNIKTATKDMANGVKDTAKKAITNNKLATKVKARSGKRADKKDEEAATALAEKRLKAKGSNRMPSQEEIDSAMKEIKANRVQKAMKKQERKDAVIGLAKDTGKLLYDNKNKIAGAGVGLVIGSMGLAAGDFMSVKEGVAGYQLGSGFIEGYLSNSLKTIKEDTNANAYAAYLLNGLSPEENMKIALTRGENEGFKEIEKLLKELTQKLQLLGVKDAGAKTGELRYQINKGTMNENTIGELLNDVPDDKKDAAESILKEYGELCASQELYKNIKTAEGMGISMDGLAGMVNITNMSTTTQTTQTTETTQTIENSNQGVTQEDINKLAEAIKDYDDNDNNSDVEELKSKLEEIRHMLQKLDNATLEQQDKIYQAINNNANIKFPDNIAGLDNIEKMKNYLDLKIEKINESTNVNS